MAKSATATKPRHTFKVEAAREFDDAGKPSEWSEVLNSRNTNHPTEKQATAAADAECERLTNGHPERRKLFRFEVVAA